MAAFESAVKQLVDMGFSEDRCRDALGQVDPPTVDAALAFLVANEDKPIGGTEGKGGEKEGEKGDGKDADGDVKMDGEAQGGEGAKEASGEGEGEEKVKVVRSYRCVETGKLFRTMMDAQLYAERTGRSNFEESDIEVPPLSEEEKAAKVAQIRQKLAEKKKEREEQEKLDAREKEKQRREGGKKMAEIRESHEKLKREAEIAAIKKEKERQKLQKEKLKREIAKDKGERAAEAVRKKGGTQEEIRAAFKEAHDKSLGIGAAAEKKEAAPVLSPDQQMDQAIQKLLQYRAGGDGLRAIKTLRKMVGNIVSKPEEPKFQTINLQNEAFKKRVATLVGGVSFLKACGFSKDATAQQLQFEEGALDPALLKTGIEKLDKALQNAQ